MNVEFLVLPLISLALGALGSIAATWSIHARLYSLEDRQSVVEGTLQREVKSRAASERWKKASVEEELISNVLLTQKPLENKKPKWWNTVQKRANGTES